MPDDLRTEIEQAYDALASDGTLCRRVAVRSSATAEDTAQFSFAGMFESYLNVFGKAGVVDAVKACWASTFGARVLFYRIKQGLPTEMPVAVVVQRMVNSEKSGVMFTTDPSTRDSTRMVIEAAWGLGESVVQGSVTPDRHVLDKESLAVLTTQIAEKEFLLAWDGEKQATTTVDLSGDPRAKAPVLTSGELTTLGDTRTPRGEALWGAAGSRVRHRGRRDISDAESPDHDAPDGKRKCDEYRPDGRQAACPRIGREPGACIRDRSTARLARVESLR